MKNPISRIVNRTNIVGVIATMEDLWYALAHPDAFQIAEWRVDCIEHPDIVPALRKLRRPVILTVRDPKHGGKKKEFDDGHVRGQLYEKYLPVATFIDVEAACTSQLGSTIHVARNSGTGVIVSCYCSDMEGLLSKFESAARTASHDRVRADILKLVAQIDYFNQFQNFIGYYAAVNQKSNIPVAAMATGRFGEISRLVFGMNKPPLTYGYLAKPAVAGQLQVLELKGMLDKMNLYRV
jgi:3-dehydroquinate dehydratase type I